MNLIEAMKEMKKGNIVLSQVKTEYKLVTDQLFFCCDVDVWRPTTHELSKLCTMEFTLKEEPTLSDKIIIYPNKIKVGHKLIPTNNTSSELGYELDAVASEETIKLISVTDLKQTIKQIKEAVSNLNYHEDCVDEIIETIDKYLGPKFKD